MSRSYEQVLDEAMRLSDEERGRLAEEMHDSLLTDEEREIEKEWIAVAERRLADFEAGLVKPVPVEESIARARAAVKSARRNPSRG